VETLTALMQIFVLLFMGGSLLGMGLTLQVKDALTGLADPRFGILLVLLAFGLGPAVAIAVNWSLHLDQSYASGLLLLGMTPCAPFLATLVERAGGDKNRTAATLLISALGTILLLPIAVPLAIPGLSVSSWTIAKPLLLVVLLPLILGIVILRFAPYIAKRMLPMIKAITSISAIIVLGLCAVLYGEGFAAAVGTRAIAAQILFFGIVTATAFACGVRLPHAQRSVLTLGICTRNVGAAIAPLIATAGSDDRTVVMVVLGLPFQLIFAFAAAHWLVGANKD
jgi:BASS family bile acid:Na+ symporter